MKIYLIGMPGSGKTTIGKHLAKQLNYQHIDLDAEIEKHALMFIDEIIEKLGIESFRNLETEVLQNIKGNNIVVSTGGGIVENRNNKKYMDGLIINLDVSNQIIEKRIENDYPRPLLIENTLDDLYQKRFLLYQHFADINISNANSITETINNIIIKIKEYQNEKNINN